MENSMQQQGKGPEVGPNSGPQTPAPDLRLNGLRGSHQKPRKSRAQKASLGAGLRES